MTTKTVCREEQKYVSPALEAIDLKNEGVLCSSIEDALEEDWVTLELSNTYEKLF